MVSDLTWNTFRNHLILVYEIVKCDGDLGAPNVFFYLNESIASQKSQTIVGCFIRQRDKNWVTEDTFSSILRQRGVESNASDKHAAVFCSRKMVY